jgi:hypothetical protein
MTMTTETLRGMLDDELSRAIERLYARLRELDDDLAVLKEERDRRALERPTARDRRKRERLQRRGVRLVRSTEARSRDRGARFLVEAVDKKREATMTDTHTGLRLRLSLGFMRCCGGKRAHAVGL